MTLQYVLNLPPQMYGDDPMIKSMWELAVQHEGFVPVEITDVRIIEEYLPPHDPPDCKSGAVRDGWGNIVRYYCNCEPIRRLRVVGTVTKQEGPSEDQAE